MSFTQEFPEDGEVVGEFGNSYLVMAGGERYSVPRTPAYELAYVHGHSNLVFGEDNTEPTEFTVDGETIRVAPTRSEPVYSLQIGEGRHVQNPPGEKDRLLTGVLEVVANGSAVTLRHLYEDLRSRQVDLDLVNGVQRQYAPVPPASVQVTDDGWVIEDLFLLTWLGTVYLVTRRFDEPTYRVGGGVSRTDEDVEFIGLTPRGEPDAFELPGDETLSEAEMLFLWKAYWLATYRNRHDDDLFWDLVEDHVQETRAQVQSDLSAGN